MELTAKLQIKPGTRVAVVGAPADGPDLTGIGLRAADPATAGAVIAFVVMAAELDGGQSRHHGGARGQAGLDRLSEGRPARH